ncbi:MAG: SPFH domain-containing protein [Bacteroidia bacterium]|nr:SPFH domain-containing protein [Bacteroidota bacterium]MBP6532514.1 SPFH domain-containing protein [Bacteroidia bacterium]
MIKEKTFKATSGFLMLVALLASIVCGIFFINNEFVPGILLCGLVMMIIVPGFVIVNPNEARVLVFFGKYSGTVKDNGFFWVNPLMNKKLISLRARNLNGQFLKVNDKMGNPIEIAAVIVWQVNETSKALFEVNDYNMYVNIQSEAAIRHLASSFPYDNLESNDDEITLRGAPEKVHEMLVVELNERLATAGIHVLEARISHLAYAQEIAHAMLQRQQATAIVAARKQIVEGAVGMVEMALKRLSENKIVDLDEERKAAMVSNLLVVLCGDRSVNPVINAGTLHN